MDRSAFTNSVTPAQHEAIRAWWQAFAEAEGRLDDLFSGRNRDFDVVGFMFTHLHAISPALAWEFGPPLAGRNHRLVVTPENRRDLRPLVQALLKAAPAASRFEFHPYRPAQPIEQAEHSMRGRCGWENIAAIGYAITPGQFNMFNLCFFLPFDGDENELTGKALILTETLLGEERLDKWVGTIDIKPKASASCDKGRPIADLHADFEARIAAARAGLVPYREMVESEATRWSLFEFKPRILSDYAARNDIFSSPAVDANLTRATIEGASFFYSERFSRDETFLYLKMDGSADDVDSEIFPDRGAIEDAIHDALKSAHLGTTIGGGTGRRYSYVDIAVTDLNAAIPLIQSTLRAGRLTKRSWLLFQDSDLQAEWIGIYEDSPGPPAPPPDEIESSASRSDTPLPDRRPAQSAENEPEPPTRH
ncbi:MAG: hypothetical protein FWD68_13925 [Alphaproteobacteria bacterium]|nr:hypothetical protein [Alphaproteobacteria bacterium]